ncbi:metallophosphoesterase [Bacillus taeanensis]|uniref:Metallophosphoesterase n=1 Tax=Bacillus taeanensis TaxID=273032 RepID=A0A366XT46_9BACI|nr:metallophosphoesterase [Bacillus taeanensis]RBW68325.1 metallophosphoesterase [Bacillus taeanensis]
MNIFFIFLFLTSLLVLFYKAYKNTEQVVINSISLTNGNNSDYQELPLNVLHISDMHLENISISPEQLYNKLKHEKIDLIALTGDFLDRKRSIPKLIPYLQTFNQLAPKFGIYAVFGNHDYVLRRKNFNVLKQTLEQYGCKTMQNENDTITIRGKRVNIIGVDDASTNRSDLAKSFAGITEGYNLVLTHDPNLVLHMKNFHFDYLLSGHFHGGQIHWPKPYHLAKLGRKMMRMNMVKGLHYYDGKAFYISEGLGQTGVNIRVGSRPEMTFHQLALGEGTKEETPTAV